MYLSDNLNKPQKYQITKDNTSINTIIPAHGYLIIWCDKLEPVSQLHASFKLDAEGGDILLTAADESWNEHLVYTTMRGDETVGRYPDGSADIIKMNIPTIAKSNITSSYTTVVTQPDSTTGISDVTADNTVGISIRYVAGRLIIRSAMPVASTKIDICNLAGQSLGTMTADLSNSYAELTLDRLPAGCFIARLSDGRGHTTSCKFIKK